MSRVVAGVTMVLLSLAVGCVEAPPQMLEAPELGPVVPVEPPSPAAISVLRRAQEVTVRIRALGCRQLGLGSGFVLPGGTVVTNRHVLGEPVQVTLDTWDGIGLDATVVGVANDSDLAVLRLADAAGLPVAELRETPVEVGEEVYAVGYPGGGPATITSGRVLGLTDGTVLGEPADVIRVDAAIRPGSSGGPLLDVDGLVVGVVFALETRSGNGLAVPVATLFGRLEAAALSPPSGC